VKKYTPTVRLRKTTREERTAYHEAGHAVAGYLLHISFGYVTIIPDEDKGSLGYILYDGLGEDFQPDVDEPEEVRRKLEPRILCALAGEAAEHRFSGTRNLPGASGDYLSVLNSVMYVCGSTNEADPYATWLYHRAQGMLRNRITWAQVKALATALLAQKHINYETACQVIAQAQADLLASRRSPQASEALARAIEKVERDFEERRKGVRPDEEEGE